MPEDIRPGPDNIKFKTVIKLHQQKCLCHRERKRGGRGAAGERESLHVCLCLYPSMLPMSGFSNTTQSYSREEVQRVTTIFFLSIVKMRIIFLKLDIVFHISKDQLNVN